jgi:hypothetical protein
MLEKDIKRNIVHWIVLNGGHINIIDQIGIKGRRKLGMGRGRGVADLIGIWRGWPLAIEVKTPEGKVSPEQHNWLAGWEKHGGKAFVFRSVDDAVRELSQIEARA